MSLDFATLDAVRTLNPAWRLLRSDHAPLVASFLQRVFVYTQRAGDGRGRSGRGAGRRVVRAASAAR